MPDHTEEFVSVEQEAKKKPFKLQKIQQIFDRCQQTHKAIRELLGGVAVDFEVTIDNDVVPFKEGDDRYLDRSIRQLLKIIPKYLETYGFKKDVLYNARLPNGMKVSKHILGYFDRNKESIKLPYYVYGERQYLQNMISNVSYLLSEKNIEKGTYYIRISTKFADFIKLGHYGCDAGSCFDDNATSYYKYNLAKANNTFVVLVSKSKEAFDNGTFSARGWGFYLPKNRTINICNIYHKGLQTETIKQIIKEVISTILDKDDIIVTDSKITVTSAIYHNQTPNWTFSDKTIKTRQRLSSDRKIQMHYRDLKHPRWPY